MYRFFGKRYSKLILSIREKKNLHDYSKEADMTTQHMSNVIAHWTKLGLIKKIKKGKEIEVKFTEAGKVWRELISKFEEMDQDVKKKINNENHELKKNERKSEVVSSS